MPRRVSSINLLKNTRISPHPLVQPSSSTLNKQTFRQKFGPFIISQHPERQITTSSYPKKLFFDSIYFSIFLQIFFCITNFYKKIIRKLKIPLTDKLPHMILIILYYLITRVVQTSLIYSSTV